MWAAIAITVAFVAAMVGLALVPRLLRDFDPKELIKLNYTGMTTTGEMSGTQVRRSLNCL